MRGAGSPTLRGGLLLALQVALAAALCAVLTVLAARHNVRIDLTPTQRFALSPSARQVAEGFDRPVRIIAFYSSQMSERRRDMADLLEQFRVAAPALSYRLLDLDRSPALASKYGISSYNSGVAEVGGEVVPLRMIDEAEVTSALLRLSRAQPRRVCFVTAHGERNPSSTDDRIGYSELGKALERERYAIEVLGTIPATGVPEACTVVVLAGPSHDFVAGEADALLGYLRGGGRVLMLVDPDAPPSVIAFLASLGIDARAALVVDQQNRFLGADAFMPQVVRFRTETFQNSLTAPAVLSVARPIGAAEQRPDDVELISLAATGPDSWAMVGVTEPPEGDVRFRREVDEVGPLSVGVMATLSPTAADAQPGKLIVFGDSDFATNFSLNLLGNKDLILSTVAVLAEEPTLVAMRRKGLPGGTLSPISLTAPQSRAIFWSSVILLPALSLLLGGIVGWRRLRQGGGR